MSSNFIKIVNRVHKIVKPHYILCFPQKSLKLWKSIVKKSVGLPANAGMCLRIEYKNAKRCECEKISKSFCEAMRMRKISKKFCEAMRNFANFRIMRFFAKCEFLHANFRKMRFFACEFSQNAIFAKCENLKKILGSDAKFCEFSQNAIFAKCEFSHAIFSQNANFECNFRMRIFKGDYRRQQLVTSWPKISHPVAKKLSKKIEKFISKNLTIRQFWLIFSEMSAPQAVNPTTRA
jgi:hypothetical protein